MLPALRGDLPGSLLKFELNQDLFKVLVVGDDVQGCAKFFFCQLQLLLGVINSGEILAGLPEIGVKREGFLVIFDRQIVLAHLLIGVGKIVVGITVAGIKFNRFLKLLNCFLQIALAAIIIAEIVMILRTGGGGFGSGEPESVLVSVIKIANNGADR